MASLLLCVSSVAAAASPIGYQIKAPSSFTKLGSDGNSSLYSVDIDSNPYTSGKVLLLDLHGSRYDQGHATGSLQGQAALENYNHLLGALLSKKSLLEDIEQDALEYLVDWQWNQVLSKQLPSQFMDEIKGFADGCKNALGPSHDHHSFCENGPGRITVLANLPGTVADVKYILLDELKKSPHDYAEFLRILGPKVTEQLFFDSINFSLPQCSMFAVWGSRTEGGRLLSGRNLDWNQDTGIDRNKLITVYHPPEAGKHAHVTFGFAGVTGSLAGMSAAGLTTHEANLESDLDTFRGFPWLYRLRHVMEVASNLEEAIDAWNSTNSTVGFNHMIASAVDRNAVVMETMAHITTYFQANSSEESESVRIDYGGIVVQGKSMSEAVFRTNHGFGQKTAAHYQWNGTAALNDSAVRYDLLAAEIAQYGPQVQMKAPDAVSAVALVGQKGPNYAHCSAPFGGSNVLSVAFDPANQVAYSAWEDGRNTSWVPAACTTYVMVNMSLWF